jgi:hypothetical protein
MHAVYGAACMQQSECEQMISGKLPPLLAICVHILSRSMALSCEFVYAQAEAGFKDHVFVACLMRGVEQLGCWQCRCNLAGLLV